MKSLIMISRPFFERITHRFVVFGALFILAFAISGPVSAAGEKKYTKPKFDEEVAVKASRAAVGRKVSSYTFRNRAGKSQNLDQYLGKPLIVSFVYSSCAYFCPMISQALSSATEIAQETFGKDAFHVVSIGIDTKVDSPDRMRLFAKTQGLDLPNWSFLSGSAKTIKGITEELGFSFAPSANGFDHLAQTTIINADGDVAHQVYGTDFEAPFLVEPLKDEIYGRKSELTSIDGLVNRVRLFCTVYDPNTGRYGFDYSLFIVLIIGGACLSLTGTFVVRSWIRIFRENRAAKSAAIYKQT